MKKLTSYKSSKFDYTLVHREGNFGIFQTENPIGWEVIRIRTWSKDRYFKGVKMAEMGDEYPPSPSDWGKHGWTALSLEHAHDILQKKLLTHR